MPLAPSIFSFFNIAPVKLVGLRLIISHHKNLNKGDYIIDDRDKRGVDKFEGEHIWFGKSEFLDWGEVVEYLCQKEDLIPPK